MNERAAVGPARRLSVAVGALLRLPFQAVAAGMDLLMTRRGMSVALLLVVMQLSTAAWLRPPLTRDIRGIDLPLGIFLSDGSNSETLLNGPHRFSADGAGVLLLVLSAASIVVVLVAPGRFGAVAGVLLSASICANAAVALNHPLLIESLDDQSEQRQQMAQVLSGMEENALTTTRNARALGLSVETANGTDAILAWPYLAYGMWLIPVTAAGMLIGYRGPLSRRLGCLILWLVVGAGLSGLVCFQRLHAEFHWLQATELELNGQLQDSRRALETSVALFPEFDDLKRTWLLAGKLDYLEGNHTAAAQFFLASQLARNGQWAMSLDVMQSLLDEVGDQNPAVRRKFAWILNSKGLEFYQQGHLSAARNAWRRATELSPKNLESVFYLGVSQARLERDRPESVEATLAPLLAVLGDRVLRADILATLGDAYFEAGQMRQARRKYEESLRAFDFPKNMNFRARKGLMGM